MTGKTEIHYEVRIKTVNDKGVESKSTNEIMNIMMIPMAEDILGNQFAKGTAEDPVVIVKIIQDKNAIITVGIVHTAKTPDGKIVNGYTDPKSNSQVANIVVGVIQMLKEE